MPSCSRSVISVCLGTACLSLVLAAASRGQDVWSGLTYTFSKEDFTDAELPENQDMITPNVVLTRGSSGGMINIAWENSFATGSSPEFTEWATDLTSGEEEVSAENYANLTYVPWLDAFGGQGSHGSAIVGRDAVLHLIAEDVYLDFRFTEWTPGSGGGFTYKRAVPPTTMPTGDYNGNLVVDAADFTIWRDTLGSMVDLRADGDTTGDSAGVINLADYNYWKARFGNTVPMGSASAASVVPEPASLLLLLGGWLIIATARRISPRGPGQVSR